ncbi:hypothetical protein ACOMHN_050319 [Nucella lapillus]
MPVWLWVHVWLSVLCLLVNTDADASVGFQQEYEWVDYVRVAKYSQDVDFSLVSFTIPPHTAKAEFCVALLGAPLGVDGRKVLLSLRRKAIPVLQAYNETKPQSFFLPSDQQVFEVKDKMYVNLTFNSPAPGRVYLVATELNPLLEVIDYLRWRQKAGRNIFMRVTANYTVRASVASLSAGCVTKVTSADGRKQVYSFRVPDYTMTYSAIINNCLHNNGGSSSSGQCPVTLTTANSLFANDASSVSVDCRQRGSQCVLNVSSPVLEQDHYVTFTFEDSGKDENVTFDFSFDIHGCEAKAVGYTGRKGMIGNAITLQDIGLLTNPDDNDMLASSNITLGPVSPSAYRDLTGIHRSKSGSEAQDPVCVNLGYLGHRSIPSQDSVFSFGADFGLWTTEGEMIYDFVVVVPDFTTEVRTFSLQESLESGGTLYIEAQIQNRSWEGAVWLCAMAHRLPLNGSVHQCPGGVLLTLTSTGNDTAGVKSARGRAFIPFPNSGSWHLAMQSQCSGPKKCEELPKVRLSVSLEQCAPNNCGRYGSCEIYTESNLLFAGCVCYAGYRGLLCNDATYSLTDVDQLRAVYLLTLSNMAFLPAVGVALFRCHFTLAAIFFFTFFFSAVYHACDTSKVFRWCLMDYNTLAFSDFLGSVLSFYAILLYMARVPDCCRAFLLLAGTLIIVVSQNDDRHNNLAHIWPLVVAGLILIFSWVQLMWKRKKLFPSKRRYLFCLLPGLVLAVIGIGVNYGLMWQKSTYQYTHSFWHVALMVTPCFLMPPRRKPSADTKRGLSISAQDIIRGGNQEQSDPLLVQQDDDEPAMFDASMNSLSADQNLLI